MVSRRAFLGGLGATGLSLPFVGRLLAQSSELPRRVLFLMVGSGSVRGGFEPRGESPGEPASATSFRFGELLAPLDPYRADALYVDGLSMWSVAGDPTTTDAHSAGRTHALSAVNRATGQIPGGATIDQAIASALESAGVRTPVRSIEAYGWGYLQTPELAPSASAAGVPVPYLLDPREVYRRLFGAGPAPGGGTEPDPAQLRRAEVLDFARGRYAEVAATLRSEDRVKLEQHGDALSDIRRRLTDATVMEAIPDPSIVAGVSDELFFYDPGRFGEVWNTTTDLNMELLVAALHADVTRVAVLSIDDAPDSVHGADWGRYGAPDSHEFLHRVTNPSDPIAGDAGAITAHRDIFRPLVAKVRRALDLLAERREADGSRLLDHTALVLCSHIADASHSVDQLPWFVFGGCGGRLRTGRMVREGRFHGDLWSTVASAMGVPMNFGDPSHARGPITAALV